MREARKNCASGGVRKRRASEKYGKGQALDSGRLQGTQGIATLQLYLRSRAFGQGQAANAGNPRRVQRPTTSPSYPSSIASRRGLLGASRPRLVEWPLLDLPLRDPPASPLPRGSRRLCGHNGGGIGSEVFDSKWNCVCPASRPRDPQNRFGFEMSLATSGQLRENLRTDMPGSDLGGRLRRLLQAASPDRLRSASGTSEPVSARPTHG
jgi:hypothetical protein